MTPAAARRIPAPFSALTALVVLVVSAALALAGAPGHAAPQADLDFKITMDVDLVIKSNDSFTIKMEMVDSSTGVEAISEDACTAESFNSLSSGDYYKNAKFTFKDEGDTRTCTIEGSGKIADAKGITHKNGEYIVDATSGGSASADSVPGLELNYSVTFPGKVTEADGGKVDGNKVTFTDSMNHKVKGKDGSIPMWAWILVGVGVLAVVAGGVAAFVITRKKKNQAQASPYAAPGQGYDPNQPFPAQPGQQPGYGAAPQGSGQPGYGAQPDSSQAYGGQPGTQPGYGAPQAQPGQPGYGPQPGQPGQPGQGTY